MNVKIILTIPLDVIDNLLCSALDPGYGGAYYWCSAKRDPSHPARNAGFLHEVPQKGGTLLICDEEDDKKTYKLDRKTIAAGLKAMSEWKNGDGAHHFRHIIAGNDAGEIDADTGDAFLQACCFGELIYG